MDQKKVRLNVSPQTDAGLFSRKKSVLLMSGALLSTLTAVNGVAQPNASKDQPLLEEVVVTGTLIRGSTPVGTQVIGLDPAQVQATGAISATELMQFVPQNSTFNTVQFSTGASTNITINRPSLRDIPGGNSGGSPTLVMFDGRRIVGMGVSSTTADPDIVPPALIQRVDIVPDGGSALYGSDAVAGVINFVTIKDFEGVQVESRYGEADSYDAFDGSITAGDTWGSGNAYISYNRAQNSALNGNDLGWFRMYPQDGSSLGLPAGQTVLATTCSPGNVRPTSGGIYALPYGPTNDGTTNLPSVSVNDCDLTKEADLYPKVERDSVMIGFNQELNDRTNLEVRSFYMNRKIEANGGPSAGTAGTFFVTLPQYNFFNSPFYADHRVDDQVSPHNVDMRYGPDREQQITLDTWGVYPTLTVQLPHEWELRVQGSYGESETNNISPNANARIQSNAIESGLFNPYDPAGSNPQAVAAISNYGAYGDTNQSLFDMSAIVDGSLFSLPGGEVKLAAGVEYQDQQFDSQLGVIVIGSQNTGFAYPGVTIDGVELIPALTAADQVASTDLSREANSVFGELVVPIIGDGNAITGIQELSVSLSGRYDDYSDFGNTTNPKYGITWRPLDWIALRGSKGTSFVAPSLANDESARLSSASAVLGTTPGLEFLLPPQELIDSGAFPPVTGAGTVIVVQGNAPDIKPQKAETMSFGFDIEPPAIENLSLSLTWWDIDFERLIDIPGFTDQFSSWTTFAPFKTVYPTQAEIDALLLSVDEVGRAASTVEGDVYAITDVRINNTGDFKTDGLDLGASYLLDADFGTVDFNFNATYVLNREQSGAPGAPFENSLEADYSRFKSIAAVGTTVGKLRAQATMRYSEGYDLGSPVGSPAQDEIDSYTTVDLFFNYDVQGEGLLQDLSFSLNVNNVLDEDPPEYRTANTLVLFQNGFDNGGTVGRFVQVGFKKKF